MLGGKEHRLEGTEILTTIWRNPRTLGFVLFKEIGVGGESYLKIHIREGPLGEERLVLDLGNFASVAEALDALKRFLNGLAKACSGRFPGETRVLDREAIAWILAELLKPQHAAHTRNRSVRSLVLPAP